MEQKQITINEIYQRLVLLEKALQTRGILVGKTEGSKFETDNEGEFTDEFKAELEKRRKSTDYVSHEEVKKRIFSKK
ncbi:MAG: hypothetical protein AABX07_02755 [Nanoarchaeota archaeon]